MQDAEGGIEDAHADRRVLQHTLEQLLAGLVLAPAQDREQREDHAGREQPDHRRDAQQVVSTLLRSRGVDAGASITLQVGNLDANLIHEGLAPPGLDARGTGSRTLPTVGLDAVSSLCQAITDEAREIARSSADQRGEHGLVRRHGSEARTIRLKVVFTPRDDEPSFARLHVPHRGQQTLAREDDRIVPPAGPCMAAVQQIGYAGNDQRHREHGTGKPGCPTPPTNIGVLRLNGHHVPSRFVEIRH